MSGNVVVDADIYRSIGAIHKHVLDEFYIHNLDQLQGIKKFKSFFLFFQHFRVGNQHSK